MNTVNITLPSQNARITLQLSEQSKAMIPGWKELTIPPNQLSPHTLAVGDEFQFGDIQNSPTLVVTKRSWRQKSEQIELTIWLDVVKN